MSNYKILAGLDIGNGYVKGSLIGSGGHSEVDIPSSVTLVTGVTAVPTKDSEAINEVKDIFNNLNVSFITPMINDNYRRLFGNRALTAGTGSFEEFDVLSNRSKASQPLSKILVLGCVVAKVLQDYVNKHGVLPKANDVLNIDVVCALALPILEYTKHRTTYANEFLSSVHTVTVHNFETPITAKVTFKSVQVIAEGASAQYAIKANGISLIEHMLKDVRSYGIELEGVTANDFLEANNTIGIDIGEGTTNFPVFTNGKFNTDASTTFNKGYGSVLSNALNSMSEQNFAGGFSSRKQLAAYLQAGVSPLKKNHYNRVKQFVDEESIFFAKEVVEKFGHLLSKVGSSTDVVYVYGGGSGPIKDILYKMLMDKVLQVMGTNEPVVMYLDSKYSRNLNREGLKLAAQNIAKILSEGGK